jgi:hypothetical protein
MDAHGSLDERRAEVTRKLMEDEHIQTVFNYCYGVLSEPLTENLIDYSPSHVSKFVLNEHLLKAKEVFLNLPGERCTVEFFLLMMIKVMRFPFEKWPYYLVGVREMFVLIAEQATDISYQQFFDYVIGELLDFRTEEHHTEFQVRFEELKNQDHFLHDAGIKKFQHSPDTHLFLALDENHSAIKVYNR